jgi:hypothetical protein
MMDICPLTGKKIKLIQPNPSTMEFFYETPMTGKVTITDIALMSAASLSEEEKRILVGMCRNKTLRNEPFRITYALFNELKNQPIPYSFEEKVNHLLQYLYDNGGTEYKSQDFDSEMDAPITFSSQEEFERIIECLLENEWIRYKGIFPSKQSIFYSGIRISKEGVEKIEENFEKREINDNKKELNELVDSIELKLRNIITSTLKLKTGKINFEDILTGEPKQQVRRRIKLHLEKHPNQDINDFQRLEKSIQFCDIEHLKTIVLKDEYWNFFEPKFKDKSFAEKYFDQFSELRHTLKHTRELTDLVAFEGQAAITWFTMVL